MKKLFLFIVLIACCIKINAQGMDKYWMYGYQGGINPNFGQALAIIDNNTFQTNLYPSDINYAMTNAIGSDSSGHLLFYANGVFLYNRFDTLMKGGDSINANPDAYQNSYDWNIPQGLFLIPFPNQSHKYIMFQPQAFFIFPFWGPQRLDYHIIDMDAENGTGEVVSYQNPLINDVFAAGMLTGVKHANGRDWWVVAKKWLSNTYYKILVTPDTMIVSNQSIGTPTDTIDFTGQAAFSPDGKWYARADMHGGVEILQFDRCNGMFGNPIHDVIDSMYCGGVCFSPSSKLLYISTYLHVYQYNLDDTNMTSTKKVVASFDGFASPMLQCYGTFYTSWLAPDDKIYIIAQNCCDYVTVINSPDTLDSLCNITPHSNWLITINTWTIPNYPNYELGPVPGTICDSLGLGYELVFKNKNKTWISPNPASDNLYIHYRLQTNEHATVTIYDALGIHSLTKTVFGYFDNVQIDVSHFNTGIYFVQIKGKDFIENHKLIVGH
nr:T9SS type A sorting domain-containing protein [Bacteroidota bacterium]